MRRIGWNRHGVARLAVVVLLVAFGVASTLVSVAIASHRTAAASRTINLSGSYTYISHINGGPSSVGTMTIAVSGHQLTGGIVLGKSGFSLKGTVNGVNVSFEAFGARGYVVHETGTASCDGRSITGGWVDSGGENGSWNATRLGHSSDASTAACSLCDANPTLSVQTARAVHHGEAVEIVLLARGLGPKKTCGSPHIDATVGRGVRLGGFKILKLSKTTARATRTVTGGLSCFDAMKASLRQAGVSAETRLHKIAGGTPTMVARAVRTSATKPTTLTATFDHLRPQSVCGVPAVQADTTVGTAHRVIPLTVTTIKHGHAVGRATLPVGSHDDCATVFTFIAREREIELSQGGVRVVGPLPTICML